MSIILVAIAFGFNDLLVSHFAFHPMKQSEQTFISEDNIEEVVIETKEGIRLQAFHLKNKNADSILVYFHGNAGNAYQRIEHVKQFRNLGLEVLLLSYRGYGNSEGEPSEQGVYEDAAAALHFVNTKLGWDDKKIVIYGRSIGSAVAINVAQHRNTLKGLILVTPLQSGREMAERMGLGWFIRPDKIPFNSIEKLKNISSPILFIHGNNDQVIPIEQGQALYEAFLGKKVFRVVKGGNHNNLVGLAGKDFWKWIANFLQDSSSKIIN